MLNTQVTRVVVVFFSRKYGSPEALVILHQEPIIAFTELTVCNAGKKPFLYILIVLTAIFNFISEDDPVLERV